MGTESIFPSNSPSHNINLTVTEIEAQTLIYYHLRMRIGNVFT